MPPLTRHSAPRRAKMASYIPSTQEERLEMLKAVVVAKHMIQNEPPYGKAVITK